MTSKAEFDKALEVLTMMLLEHGNDGVDEKEYRGFIHIATTLMREAFADGLSGSGVPDMIAKLKSLNNPLSVAIASAVQWSYEQGKKARV